MRSTVISAKTVDECVDIALKQLNASRDEVNIDVIDEAKQGFFGLFGKKDAVVRVSLKDDVKDKESDDFVKSILNTESLSSIDKDEVDSCSQEQDSSEILEDETNQQDVVDDSDESSDVDKSSDEKNDVVCEDEQSDEIEVEVYEINDEFIEEPIDDAVEASDDSDVNSEDDVKDIQRTDEIFITTKNFLKQMIEDMGISCDIESRTDKNLIKFNIICSDETDIGIIIGKRGETLDSLQYIVNLVTNRNSDTYIRVILDCNQYRTKREKSLEKLAKRLAEKAVETGRDIKLEPMNPYERRIIHTYLQNNDKVKTFSQGNEPNRRVIIKRK